METIKLYALPLSGYCAKVRIVLRIKGLPFEELPPLGGHYSSEAHQQHMPPGSIPCIGHGVFKLFDSEAIVEYLEDLSPEPAMRSQVVRHRAKQRALAQFHNTRVEPVVRGLFPLVKAGAENDDGGAIDAQLSALTLQLDKLCQVADFRPFIGGAAPCLADCGFPLTLRMAQDIFAHLDREAVFPEAIDVWLAACEGHKIMGEEIRLNRDAVAEWLSRF